MSYRTHGVETVSFDEGTANHWPTVVASGFSVSYSSLCHLFSNQSVIDADDGMVTLSARKVVHDGLGGLPSVEGDKQKFPTKEDATRFAYEHGYLRFYERISN